jgi:hypothetical protein
MLERHIQGCNKFNNSSQYLFSFLNLIKVGQMARRWKPLSREKDWQRLEIFAGKLERKAMATPELG